jgi:hypothetical protein
MSQTAARFVYGRTLNYNHSKPYIPPAPALPRFTLPSEGSEEAVDPLDSAATAQRPTVDAARARRVVRRAKPKVDATSEVQVEDILLEVYAEDPPPPATRRSPGAPPVPPQVTIAAAIASVVPPPSAQSAAVDALLRASDPAFLPFGGRAQHVPPPPPPTPAAFAVSPYAHAPSYGYGATDRDVPSFAPVAFPSAHMPISAPTVPPPSRAFAQSSPTVAPRKRGGAIAIWTVVLLIVGVGAGAGAAIGVRNGTYARARDGAKELVARAGSKTAPKAEEPAVAAAAPPPVTAQPAAPVASPSASPASPPPLPTVSVDSLPQQTIPADSSLVTFPASAQGRRVFFDGRPMAITSAPMKLQCGRHNVRIGSKGKARVTDLPCGREITLK